jgi:CHAT domain
MIEVTFAPTELVVDEPADLTVRFTNRAAGPCFKVIFTLTLPGEIMLLRGTERIEVSRLEPGESVTRTVQVKPLRAARCRVTSTNFSYRDRFNGVHREDRFQAELVTRPPVPRPATPPPRPAGPAVTIELSTRELPYGEWARLRGQVANAGPAGLTRLELGLSGPLQVAGRGRWLSLGHLPPAAAVGFEFHVCARRAAGQVPVYLAVSYTDRGMRRAGELVATVQVAGRPPEAAAPQPRTVLFFGANPDDTEWLRIDREYRDIAQILERAGPDTGIVVRPILAARPDDIVAGVAGQKPWIVHFAGHGAGPGTGLLAEGGDGLAQAIAPQALARLFAVTGHEVACVLINACGTDAVGEALAPHVASVIMMSQPIYDRSAIEFSKGFYRALTAGYPIGAAFELGRVQLQMMAGGADHEIPRLLGAGLD